MSQADRMVLGEHIQDIKKRLSEVGLWKEACALRDQIAREKHCNRMEAWRYIMARHKEYWQINTDKIKEQLAEKGGANGAPAAAPTSKDCEWVVQNMDFKELEPKAAPTPAAWSLLIRARKDSKVYQWVLDHVAPKSFVEKEVESGRWEKDPMRKLTNIEQQIAEEMVDA